MRLKIIAAVAFIAVGVGAVGFVLFASGPGSGENGQFLTAQATRTTVVQQSVANGNLAAATTYGLAFGSDPTVVSSSTSSSSAASGSGSWVVDSVAVEVGDLVTEGQTLARADASAAQTALELAKANLAIAKANLAVDTAGPTAAERSAAYDSIRAAQQQLSAARRSQSQTASQSALQLPQAQEDLKLAQDKLAADQAAGPSSTTIEADQSAIRSAQQQIDSLSLQIQGSDATASDTQQQNSLKLSQANLSLQAAQAKLLADLLADPLLPAGTISADQAAVTAAQSQVDTIILQIQAANTQATQTSKQNALKLQQAQEALKLAQDKLAADQAAGPSSTTIAADQSAIRAAQRQVDNLTLSAKNSAANATAQIASASQSLTATKNAYALKVAGATAAQIEADRASVANAQESVRQAQSTLDGATLTSPADGLVVAVNVVSGTIAPSGSAITLESGPMVVTAAFAESDIPSIEVGQTASVTVTALKKAVAGKVTRINPVAAGTGSSSVVTYQVQVTLDTADPGMRVGMSASVAVTTAQAANVIAVPSIALSGSDGSYAVQVVDANGQAQLVSVQVGLVTSSMAEIQSGLEVGETVVIGSSTQRTGGTTTTGGGFGFPVGGGGRTQP